MVRASGTDHENQGGWLVESTRKKREEERERESERENEAPEYAWAKRNGTRTR